ncbi:MAG TPA: hypothetical protein VMC09_13890 [Anaerolineales bacterium]|nr:hypothetical protein [Anaerolineales bacterium]
MSSLAEMKADLTMLEEQKKLLRVKMAQARKQAKVGLWIIGGGVTLIPLYGAGVILLILGIVYAFVNNERKNKFQDSLADIQNRIKHLEELMA